MKLYALLACLLLSFIAGAEAKISRSRLGAAARNATVVAGDLMPEADAGIYPLTNLTDRVKMVERRPRVNKFAQNIYYDVYYSQSAVYDYIKAFFQGYNFQDYSFAQECLDDTTLFLDQLHNFHFNMTRRRDWSEPYFLTFQIIGNQFNDSWFFCYQMVYDIYLVYKQKVENFVDFGDVYMSFIFNLLSNSL
jgi:hypothetical protein